MSWVDVLIGALIMLSAVVGMWRGLVRESLSLIVWLLALWLAWILHPISAGWLEGQIGNPGARAALAFLLVVVAVLALGAVFGALCSRLLERQRLRDADRALGFLFGAARGAVSVAMMAVLAALTPLAHEPLWQDSQLLTDFYSFGYWLVEQVPESLQARLRLI